MTICRQELDYFSCEKFQGFLNVFIVAKLTKTKKKLNAFSVEKKLKAINKKQNKNYSDFDGCLKKFEYSNFKSMEKFYGSFCNDK